MNVDLAHQIEVGDWIRWRTPTQVKEGQVILAEWPSLGVEWLGGGTQVFPYIEGYSSDDRREYAMVVIPRPQGAAGIERDVQRGIMSVKRAAALLGTTRKQIRAWLRNGTLSGIQDAQGRWVSVDQKGVHERLNLGPKGT